MGCPRGLAAAALAALALTGCNGAPDELSREEGRRIGLAAEHLDDAIDTHETLRTSRAEAQRIRARVRSIVARGAFESDPLDEFGLAALGELREVVPSLVITAGDGTPTRLDRPGTRAFLRYALTDADRALAGPAGREVGTIERVVEDSDADAGTEVPRAGRVARGDRTMGDLLRRLERELTPVLPALAERLRRVRSGL